MSVSTTDRFPSRLKTISDAPEVFRNALSAYIPDENNVRFIIWGPASKSLLSASPATLLIITDKKFVVVSELKNNETIVACSDFLNILLIELTRILLAGRLKIDYFYEDGIRSIAIDFNTVMHKLYREAVEILLEGINKIPNIQHRKQNQTMEMLDKLPFKFRSAVLDYCKKWQDILSVVHIPAIIQSGNIWFKRELHPQTVLVLTERILFLISEEKGWSWFKSVRSTKYGEIVTYCPLLRFVNFKILRNQQYGRLEIDVGNEKYGEKLLIDFPYEKEHEIVEFVEFTMEQREIINNQM